LIIGFLAVLLALGGHQHVDQRGALTELIAQPFGSFLVVILAVGSLPTRSGVSQRLSSGCPARREPARG
jgi:hypothetical protein